MSLKPKQTLQDGLATPRRVGTFGPEHVGPKDQMQQTHSGAPEPEAVRSGSLLSPPCPHAAAPVGPCGTEPG